MRVNKNKMSGTKVIKPYCQSQFVYSIWSALLNILAVCTPPEPKNHPEIVSGTPINDLNNLY